MKIASIIVVMSNFDLIITRAGLFASEYEGLRILCSFVLGVGLGEERIAMSLGEAVKLGQQVRSLRVIGLSFILFDRATFDVTSFANAALESSDASFGLVRLRAPGASASEIVRGAVSNGCSVAIGDITIAMAGGRLLVLVKLLETCLEAKVILIRGKPDKVVVVGRIGQLSVLGPLLTLFRGREVTRCSGGSNVLMRSLLWTSTLQKPQVPVIVYMVDDGTETRQRDMANSQRNLVGVARVDLLEGFPQDLATHVSRAVLAIEEEAEVLQRGRRHGRVRVDAANLLAEPDGTERDDAVEDNPLARGVDSPLYRVLTHEANTKEVSQAVASQSDLGVVEDAFVAVHGEFGRRHVDEGEVVTTAGTVEKLLRGEEAISVLLLYGMTIELLVIPRSVVLVGQRPQGGKKKLDDSALVGLKGVGET